MKRGELNLSKLRDVIIFPFYECNMRCKGCFVKKPAGETGYLKSPVDAFERHIDAEHLERINNWVVKHVTILGGEPFLSAVLPDMLKILRKGNAQISVYTNATLIYDKIDEIRDVLELIDYLVVSIEGTRYWTEKIRGKVFDKCMITLEKLLDTNTKPVARASFWDDKICTRCGHNVIVTTEKGDRCAYCGSNKIRSQIFDLVKITEELNSKQIPVEIAPRIGEPLPSISEMRWFYAAIASMKMAAIITPSYYNYVGFDSTCSAGWNRLSITPDGFITPCQWNFTTIAHIMWDDDDIIKYANSWVERQTPVDSCYGCDRYMICRSSCKIACDYLSCPLKNNYVLDKTDTGVKIGNKVVEISTKMAKRNIRKMRGLAPFVC